MSQLRKLRRHATNVPQAITMPEMIRDLTRTIRKLNGSKPYKNGDPHLADLRPDYVYLDESQFGGREDLQWHALVEGFEAKP